MLKSDELKRDAARAKMNKAMENLATFLISKSCEVYSSVGEDGEPREVTTDRYLRVTKEDTIHLVYFDFAHKSFERYVGFKIKWGKWRNTTCKRFVGNKQMDVEVIGNRIMEEVERAIWNNANNRRAAEERAELAELQAKEFTDRTVLDMTRQADGRYYVSMPSTTLTLDQVRRINAIIMETERA